MCCREPMESTVVLGVKCTHGGFLGYETVLQVQGRSEVRQGGSSIREVRGHGRRLLTLCAHI